MSFFFSVPLEDEIIYVDEAIAVSNLLRATWSLLANVMETPIMTLSLASIKTSITLVEMCTNYMKCLEIHIKKQTYLLHLQWL